MFLRALLPFVLALTACTGTPVESGPSTLHARGLLVTPEQPVRVAFHSGSTGIRLRPEFTPQDAFLRVCAGVPTGCLEAVAWGVRTPFLGTVEEVTFEADRAVTLDFTAEFFPRGDTIEVVLPRVRSAPSEAACSDNACRAVFELTPVHTGTLTASARLTGDRGELAILSGRILARSQTATGVPYRVADVASGSGPLRVEAQLDQGSEFAVVFGQLAGTGSGSVRDARLRMRWPGP